MVLRLTTILQSPTPRLIEDKPSDPADIISPAKQRATIKWLLSKAFNNRVPENLHEQFYRNHEDQEHLRPQLVHCLANAELYCMALSNIYSDPNFNNLNHGGVLQALARKGVYISDPHITETVLIQTTPIKLSAHQVVMQAVMTLYAKEVATPEFVYAAVKRLMPGSVDQEIPQDYESALLFWINQVTTALKLRADQEDSEKRCPDFPKAKQLQDLCDGASLAGLVSFYCPEELHWSSICVSQLPTVPDCVRNLTLVSDFCQKALPYNIFHMAPEDVYYMRGSMKHNLIVFLADLFNVLEIHPAPCVTLNSASRNTTNAEGRNLQGVAHKRSLPQAVSAIPDLRSGLDSPSSFSGTPVLSSGNLKKNHTNHHTDQGDNSRSGGEEFVVHRGRGVTTLSSVIGGNESPIPNNRSTEPAGIPTNWEPRKQSFAGRRSRRNSLSEDSQLTLENFGGSQENLHLLGRNPDKEPAVHSGRRESIARSSVLDNNSDALHYALQETYVKQQAPETSPRVVTLTRNNSFIEGQRRAEETRSSAGLQQLLLDPSPSPTLAPQSPLDTRPVEKEKKVTTFAALPNNTTTWQQQSMANQNNDHQDNGTDIQIDNTVMGSQLMNIRLKLEEKRRRIESEKRRMEAQLNRQRQKVGKAAFLQAVSKGKVVKSPDSDPGRETTTETPVKDSKPARPFSLQDITEVEQKWLSKEGFTEERKTPDMENMDIETYQQSIAQMNSSLHEIQADLQRLANQQNQLQSNQIVNQPVNIQNLQQTPPPQQQPQQQQQQPQPQQHMAPMQSFASLHQQSNYSTQHINFNNHTPNFQQQQQQQQQPQQQPIYSNQPYQMSPLVNQQMPPHINQQSSMNSHEYFNGGRQMNSFNNQQQQMQQMHSLMSTANSQQAFNNTQQWHSLSQPQQQPNYGTYSANTRYNQGFTLHNYDENYTNRQDKGEFYLHEPQPQQRRNWGQPYTPDTNTWSNRMEPSSLSSSPKQAHFLHNGSGDTGNFRNSSSPASAPTPPPRSSVNHAPLPTPPVDDMEPQSISFIGSGEDQEQLTAGLSKINITSGNRTYRIPSPTRNYTPIRNSFSQQHEKTEQGFYISFDDTNNQPKRPKPPLRTKRNSPKKERALTQVLDTGSVTSAVPPESKPRVTNSPPPQACPTPAPPSRAKDMEPRVPTLPVAEPIVIGNQPDPGTLDEMEKKKERILMMSLQRRQAAEEARNVKEAEIARRRDQEKAKEEEKQRKKEEEKRRRAQILEQYKIKKAIEEAEREGKQVDKELLHSLKATIHSPGTGSSGAKMRNKPGQPTRPRPKTIHIDSGADAHDGTMTPSRGKKGSSSNLSAFGTPMRRDYYRGSQDCLTETRKNSSRLYSEIGDESRGTSPGRSLGRRSSYKTSRDASPEVRTMGRSKYGTYQARRKSNSLMNLAGSSCDQDSLAYRYGDTDSGLGRATPPRRVPSPSGPGSLPASHRRRFDDNMSDAGSDYTGPRLYRQPTTKSNKGIVLNAVEYCVFPGVVNKEAKMRVIEEMNRSEAKHFLVLFRDAGCQFRALYAYYPDTEEIVKLYGTGPKQVTDRMFDKFFKYNSGGKCFSQVHTKHLTVTIDAFTIHNSLWQGKKVNLPNKRDMTLVI
ncbi:patronin isoform X4 [Cimex lectularius]|uniref:Patronin n=1 Tax=Cimex lectularius TaxID=79782 RepID=A0A8I6SBY0_CIMLE|nr:patronin isoform X4 [Cimex lectularius]